MTARRRPYLALALATLTMLLLSACGASEPVAVGPDTVVIDVRTPEEFAEGHLDGAVNISLLSGTFAQDVATLDRDADYVVYCRSGNRSAEAKKLMEAAGFTSVHDAGSVRSAADTTGLLLVAG